MCDNCLITAVDCRDNTEAFLCSSIGTEQVQRSIQTVNNKIKVVLPFNQYWILKKRKGEKNKEKKHTGQDKVTGYLPGSRNSNL